MVTYVPDASPNARYTVAALAAGGFLMIAAVVFLFPFVLSARAHENDVFMTNAFISPLIYLIGSTLAISSLPGLGLSRLLTVVLAVANPFAPYLALVALSSSGPPWYGVIGPLSAVDGGLLILLGLAAAAVHERLRLWGIGLLFALAGSGAVALAYALFGSRYYAYGETVSSLPPYLDLPMLGITLALAVAILLGARAAAAAGQAQGA
jgi:hypothetical protein